MRVQAEGRQQIVAADVDPPIAEELSNRLIPKRFCAAKAGGSAGSISPRVKKMLGVVKTKGPIGATLQRAGAL
jgi:hypothetical protein